MKEIKIVCTTASTVHQGIEVKKSRQLAEITIKVDEDFQLTEEIKKELFIKASEMVSGIATKEGDVYQCNCTLVNYG